MVISQLQEHIVSFTVTVTVGREDILVISTINAHGCKKKTKTKLKQNKRGLTRQIGLVLHNPSWKLLQVSIEWLQPATESKKEWSVQKRQNDLTWLLIINYYYYRHQLFLTTKVTKEVFLTLGSSLLQLVLFVLYLPTQARFPSVPNEVLESRHPTQIFTQGCTPVFKSQISVLFCFKMPNAGLEIAGSRKTYWIPSFQLDENVSRTMCQLWRENVTNHVPRELDSTLCFLWGLTLTAYCTVSFRSWPNVLTNNRAAGSKSTNTGLFCWDSEVS